MPRLAALLFDLDGTLVDSAADLAASANAARAALGFPPLAPAAVVPMIGDGVQMLMTRALADRPGADVSAGIAAFRAHYAGHCCDRTRAYPGVAEALTALAAFPKVVVSNKPEGLSHEVLAGCGLARHFVGVVGGDSTPERKPEAAPFRLGLARAGVRPGARVAMVGDAHNDIDGGRRAGLVTCAALWGLTPRAALLALRPDLLAEVPGDLPGLLGGEIQ